ncbi:plasmid transfer protein TraA [Streptomyces sp. NPDC059788]|uniref:plasmid transfer protein TraA n=1 Tax=Streptomyces sp. NPDC059788 TaxID=3346948 RepID=UPI003648267C
MAAANGSGAQVPPQPNYPPTNGRRPSPSEQVRAYRQAVAQQPYAPPQRTRNTKIEVNKLSLLPADGLLPPMTFSFNKTVVNGGGSSAGDRKALPGSGFTSDEDLRAFSEAIRKDARPRAVERALDAETLEGVLRSLPDQYGSMSGSRARARRVARPLRRIAAAEKLIAKQGALLWAIFTREFEAQLAQVSSGHRRGDPRHRQQPGRNTAWKNW